MKNKRLWAENITKNPIRRVAIKLHKNQSVHGTYYYYPKQQLKKTLLPHRSQNLALSDKIHNKIHWKLRTPKLERRSNVPFEENPDLNLFYQLVNKQLRCMQIRSGNDTEFDLIRGITQLSCFDKKPRIENHNFSKESCIELEPDICNKIQRMKICNNTIKAPRDKCQNTEQVTNDEIDIEDCTEMMLRL